MAYGGPCGMGRKTLAVTCLLSVTVALITFEWPQQVRNTAFCNYETTQNCILSMFVISGLEHYGCDNLLYTISCIVEALSSACNGACGYVSGVFAFWMPVRSVWSMVSHRPDRKRHLF